MNIGLTEIVIVVINLALIVGMPLVIILAGILLLRRIRALLVLLAVAVMKIGLEASSQC